jgi:protein involved in polysaccharide export with SLBB domain
VSLDGPLSNAIAVLGEVNSPLLFPLDRDTRVSEAIARAGGATELAAASRVRIIRKTGAEEVLYLANLDNIQGGISQTDMLLQRGDMVFVPPAATVEAGYALRRFLFPFEQLMRTVVGPLLGFALR